MAPQEFTGDIERLARGPQQSEVGGEDGALCPARCAVFGLRAGFRQQVAWRVVEQDLVASPHFHNPVTVFLCCSCRN